MNNRTLCLYGISFLVLMVAYQVIDYTMFRNKGARFTAADGQALCERIKPLEKESKPCEYIK